MLREHILYIVFSYLLGAVPFGYIIVRLTAKKDIRTLGSKSTGATNVLRSKGPVAALFTLILDVLKGAVPIIYGKVHLFPPFLMLAAGTAAVIGHIFPVFIKFRGGKGVSVMAGVFIVFYIPALAVFFIVWLLMILLTRFVSLGSILGLIALFFTVLFTQTAEISFIALFIVLLIIGKHSANIKRLLGGTENKLQMKKRQNGA